LRNYRRAKKKKKDPETPRRPYAKNLALTDCYGFRIFGRLSRLLFRKGEYIFIVLNDHTLKTLSDCYKPRSITLTPESLSIAYSQAVVPMTLRGMVGIDRNLDNVTTADTD
jgi:hypothetical protein